MDETQAGDTRHGTGWASEVGRMAAGMVLMALAALAWSTEPPEETPVQAIASAKASRTLLLDVAQAGSRLVAVGDRGHILYSDDQGRDWRQASVPSRALLTAVTFVDAQHGWAVGHDAQILASADGGLSWGLQHQDLERQAPLLDVWFGDTQHGIAVGAYGALLETRDGGQHWEDIAERLDNEDQFHLNGIAAVKDAGLFVVGEAGSMFRSTDDGQHWERVQSPYEGSLFGVIGTARAHTLLAYGLRGNLFRSEDFGDTWQPIALGSERGPLQFSLSGAGLLANGGLVLVGNGGSVLRSDDNGQRFSVFTRGDRIALAGVAGTGDGELVLVGQGGAHLALATGQDATQSAHGPDEGAPQ